MMHTLSDLTGFSLHATDGNIGSVRDFYFDDRRWVIRHLVVEIGSALKSHKVLLSPAVIKHLNREEKTITVDMSVSEVENSPHINIERNSFTQYEIDYLSYYGYAFYWGNNLQNSLSSDDEAGALPADNPADKSDAKAEDIFLAIDSVRRKYGDRHLRSCHEIVDYHIQAIDGEIGHLQSMLIDEDTWTIQYCIANTSNWWFGHQVLITPQAITDVSWGSTKIYVDMTQQQVKEAPVFDPSAPANRERELGVYLHYGRGGYAKADKRL
ncbi:MAG: PRC-barrel domain-containing protein [Cellvibrio sp.]